MKLLSDTTIECNKLMSDNAYLFLTVGLGNDFDLSNIVAQCVANDHCDGIVFEIDKEAHFFDDLMFLKDYVIDLLAKDKRVGLWGIPECVIRIILDSYWYMRFLETKIAGNNVYDCCQNAIYLPECENCLDRGTCSGTGNKNRDFLKKRFKRSKSKPKVRFKTNLFQLPSTSIFNKYKKFLLHSSFGNKASSTTDRYVYFATSVDYGSVHAYANRFVYMCNHLNSKAYDKEFDFLRKQSINSAYVDLIQSVASVEKTMQVAYSLAEKNGIYRESFYMYTPEHYGERLLKDFNIHYVIPQSKKMKFIGVGIDVIDEKNVGYKLYFKCPKNFLSSYFEPLGIELKKVKAKLHYLVWRLDNEQKLLSYKIEVLIGHKDFKLFKNLIDNYEYFDRNFEKLDIFNVAIEFEEDKISKINLYHRNYLAKGDSDAV
ncbi:MAG: hypothetical protein ACWGHH_03970 [Sulfurovaceae bacterium]